MALVSPSPSSPAVPSRAAAPETPFFFESHGKPLYAVFHAAAPARPEARAAEPRPTIVHVHSIGVEQITLYRAEVLAARAAATHGFPVLRFHARGHGDSAGSFADVTLDTLVQDAGVAADEARRRSGATRVLWLGVRFGALVAALAARGRDDAAGFVFWEPVHKPGDFFRQQLRTLLFSQVAGGKKPDATVDEMLERIASDGRADVLGYYLHRALVDSARDASLTEALEGASAPVRLAQVQARAKLASAHHQLAESLFIRGVDVKTALVHEDPGYQLMSNPAWESDALTRTTVEWLDALA